MRRTVLHCRGVAVAVLQVHCHGSAVRSALGDAICNADAQHGIADMSLPYGRSFWSTRRHAHPVFLRVLAIGMRNFPQA